MGDGAISNGQISASSQLDADHAAINGRITSSTKGSWSAFNNDVSEWLQIDLGSQEHTLVAKIATQGENAKSQWVKHYTLQYSNTGLSFYLYKGQGQSEGKVGKQITFNEHQTDISSDLHVFTRGAIVLHDVISCLPSARALLMTLIGLIIKTFL